MRNHLVLLVLLTTLSTLSAQEPFGAIGDLKLIKPADKVDVPSTPAPKDAILLLNGKDLDNWSSRDGTKPADWKLLPGGIVEVKSPTADIITRRKFGGKFKLHVEFRVPYQPKAKGQRRGNSGVYLQGRYEIQVLDSYGLKPEKNECGAVYSIAAPNQNVCKAPTVWQSFDIEYQSPTCADGKKKEPGVVTVYHNGVKIHDRVKITIDNSLRGLGGDVCSPGPILLQENGCPVQYRNIWLLPLEPAAEDMDVNALGRSLAPFFRPPPELAKDLGNFRSPLKFYDGTPVKDAAQWPKRRQEIRAKWHELMGPWPELLAKPKIEFLDKERRENLTQQHVRIEVAPGKMTDDAYLMMPDGKGPFPAVVVVFYDAKTGIGLGKSPQRDFALQLAKRGFVALSLGSAPETYYPNKENFQLQPLSYHGYEAANCHTILTGLEQVDPKRIGIVGHSYGGKWAMFASCLYDKFACAAWSDGGIVFDEKRGNVNYWERWYLGAEKGIEERKPGIPSDKNPRTGPYKKMVAAGHDLHELHALMAPRPFLVSGGSEDQPERWKALNHAIAVNDLLGYKDRVAMTNRKGHSPTPESNEQLYLFFEYFLKHGKALVK